MGAPTNPVNVGDPGSPRGHPDSPARVRLVDAAMRRFAESGYDEVRAEDVAADLGLAKASVFKQFRTKEALFLACFRRAARSLPAYLDAPPEVRERGFFATVRFWLERTEHLVQEDWVPYRVTLAGSYGTPLRLRREINRFLAREDPYGTAAFVRFGIERGEVRSDVDPAMIVAMVDWLVERFQDALLTEELDPGLFPRYGGLPAGGGGRIEQFVELLRSAIAR
jgi:AcrR family transcriptional regulator